MEALLILSVLFLVSALFCFVLPDHINRKPKKQVNTLKVVSSNHPSVKISRQPTFTEFPSSTAKQNNLKKAGTSLVLLCILTLLAGLFIRDSVPDSEPDLLLLQESVQKNVALLQELQKQQEELPNQISDLRDLIAAISAGKAPSTSTLLPSTDLELDFIWVTIFFFLVWMCSFTFVMSIHKVSIWLGIIEKPNNSSQSNKQKWALQLVPTLLSTLITLGGSLYIAIGLSEKPDFEYLLKDLAAAVRELKTKDTNYQFDYKEFSPPIMFEPSKDEISKPIEKALCTIREELIDDGYSFAFVVGMHDAQPVKPESKLTNLGLAKSRADKVSSILENNNTCSGDDRKILIFPIVSSNNYLMKSIEDRAVYIKALKLTPK
ncbi:OmpA family protein [Bowmanella denitrificans]|uniref:OmpA family protein n=1 Tax=Bowmanella denitrificans TaxID=366582 RepID=UPI000C9B3840|nr:OmpA family protein [Bowmanella denitrificans]